MTSAEAVVIREATAADLPRLIELLFQLSQIGAMPETDPRPVTATHERMLEQIQRDPRVACLVLEADGAVMGTLTLYLLPNLSHGALPFAIVENVVIDHAARGRRYGELLMQEAESRAWAAGCYKLALTSNKARTDAHRFYERIGYTRSHEGMTKYREK